MIIDRIQTRVLQEMLGTFPVVAVVGARQVGKSTLVNLPELGADRLYLSLDDMAVLGLAEKDPVALVNSAERVTIDEVQRVPRVLMAVKREVDRDRRPGRFLLTGSADLNFSANLARVLAGRLEYCRFAH